MKLNFPPQCTCGVIDHTVRDMALNEHGNIEFSSSHDPDSLPTCSQCHLVIRTKLRYTKRVKYS